MSWPEPTPATVGGKTTDGNIARRNLAARIDGLSQAIKKQPHLSELRKSLVDALLTRSSFFGTYADFARALEYADDGVSANPKDSKALILRAQVLSSIHRFEEAENIVAGLASEHPSAAAVLETIHLARGEDLEAILANRRARAKSFPSFASWSALAASLASLGHFDEADAAYREAIAVYRDVSPFPYSWVAFQRAVMWSEHAGQPKRGFLLYSEAVHRLPGYVAAQVHLAELEWTYGHKEKAIARLSTLKTEDPEPEGLLSEILSATDPERARTLVKSAKTQYDSLLKTYRLAFLDHASEFFAGPGEDPVRALGLALENLANRPTERARLVAIEAALAAQKKEEACALAKAVPAKPVSVPLAELVPTACP